MKSQESIFGKGIAFPPRIVDGRLQWSSGTDNIRESIKVILLTQYKERVNLPEFGGDLNRFIYEPNTAAIRHRMEKQISAALSEWEPRIAVEAVTAQEVADDPTVASVTIIYRLVATQQAERLSVNVKLQG